MARIGSEAVARSDLAVAVAAVVVLSACGTGGLGRTTPSPSPTHVPPSPTAVAASPSADAASPRPSTPPASVPPGSVAIEVSNWPPGAVLTGDDAMWVTVSEVTSIDVVRIDPATNDPTVVLDDLPAEQIVATGIGGSVWVVSWDNSTVTQYDAATGERLRSIPVGASPVEPAVAFGDLWTLNHHGGSVTRIDTATSTVEATIAVADTGLSGPHSYAVAGDMLWVAAPSTPHLVAIDPQTNQIAHTLELPPDCEPEITDIDGRIWLWGCEYGGGNVIDPRTLEAVGTHADIDTYLTPPLLVDGRSWVAAVDPLTTQVSALAAVDADDFSVVEQLAIEPHAGAAAVGFDSFWLTIGRVVYRVPASSLER